MSEPELLVLEAEEITRAPSGKHERTDGDFNRRTAVRSLLPKTDHSSTKITSVAASVLPTMRTEVATLLKDIKAAKSVITRSQFKELVNDTQHLAHLLQSPLTLVQTVAPQSVTPPTPYPPPLPTPADGARAMLLPRESLAALQRAHTQIDTLEQIIGIHAPGAGDAVPRRLGEVERQLSSLRVFPDLRQTLIEIAAQDGEWVRLADSVEQLSTASRSSGSLGHAAHLLRQQAGRLSGREGVPFEELWRRQDDLEDAVGALSELFEKTRVECDAMLDTVTERLDTAELRMR